MRTLTTEGIRIALDDFGTGYASLSHLKQYPVIIIKIDRSFVQDLASNSANTAIISSVLALGRSLGLTTVAEGVETTAQARFLEAHGCDQGQGFLFGRPNPSGFVSDQIALWKPESPQEEFPTTR